MPRASRRSSRPSPCRMTRGTRSSRTCRSSTRSVSSIGRSQAGLEYLADRLGPERLFIGPVNAQATEQHFRWEELVAVTDLASARRANRHDRGAGRGGQRRMGATPTSGGLPGRPRRIPLAIKRADPGFEPARPVVAANVRQQATGVAVPADHRSWNDAPAWTSSTSSTRSCSSSCPATFAHTDESPEQLQVLADVSVGLMYTALKPTRHDRDDASGRLGTRRASPQARGSSCSTRSITCCPIARAAWILMEERLAGRGCVRRPPAVRPVRQPWCWPLAKVARAPRDLRRSAPGPPAEFGGRPASRRRRTSVEPSRPHNRLHGARFDIR